MSSNRPNLILDEQAFQDLLSAAFTIQEHNARLSQVRQTDIKASIRSQAETDHFCHQCGALKTPGESCCPRCGLDEYRQGERMQRKWASMWLMSQEQTLWPERPAPPPETLPEAGGPREFHRDPPKTQQTAESRQIPLLRSTDVRSTGDPAIDNLLADPSRLASATGAAGNTVTAAEREAAIQQQLRTAPIGNQGGGEKTALANEWVWGPNFPGESAKEVLAPEPSDRATPTFQFQASHASTHDSPPTYAVPDETPERTTDGTILAGAMSEATAVSDSADDTSIDSTYENAAMVDASMLDAGMLDTSGGPYAPSENPTSPSLSLGQRLAHLTVTLRFHRANLYLGAAIFLAAVALMWPTVSAPKPAELSLVERALVAIGIAEAPAPVIHSTGDPSINVWVDPHTALYYCPGEEQYGKTQDGRVSSQHDAQMDRFQPAGRSPCE